MVYITSWQEYQEAAEALYTKSPNTVRTRSPLRSHQIQCKILDPLLRKMEVFRG